MQSLSNISNLLHSKAIKNLRH